MKKINFLNVTIGTLLSISAFAQTTFVQWNFNSQNTTPNVGSGTVALVGGTTQTYAAGSGSSDPITGSANQAYNTTTYAAQSTGDKTRGVQFNVSTVLHRDIIFSYDVRLSNTANKTYVVQYSTDTSASTPVWTDFYTFTGGNGGDQWYNNNTVDLSSITALNNNANVGIRIVSALAGGVYTAATSGSNYATTGTVRYDMVTFAGTSLLAVNETQKGKSQLYPNPVNANENVTFGKATDYEVFSVNGQLLKSGKNTKSFSTSNLSKGVYIIKTNEGTQKLIVK
ncbi:T9SS type A sorting domain-containing protein [Epilithonimonas hominis]|uniref:T9SS type A sorting domain-containing protein n=1 Tax=Epilithonimonas hominis TaxID=420404 RepID=UPI00289B2773|nr:T9SS type A sorting domain-containing protein [Epilithonimonas hominis]